MEEKTLTIEEALKEIDRLKDLNASFRGAGKVNREAKNSVFLNMFKRKEYLLDTLMNYYVNNDVNLHGRIKVEMPDIETYVVYTGKSIPKLFSELDKDENGRYILSLNKEFFEGKAGQPELLAKVIYVKNGSGILEEYIRFSQIFDEQMAKYEEKDKAMQEIFRICIEENILKEYLEAHRGEVEKIMLTMVSPEYIEKAEQKSMRIREAILTAKEFGHSDEEIKNHLIKKFNLTPGYAQNWLDGIAEEEETEVLV